MTEPAPYRAPAPPPNVVVRDPFASKRSLVVVGVLVFGGHCAATRMEQSRGLSLRCSHAEAACTLREDYGIFTRTRRFADGPDDPVLTAYHPQGGGTTLVVFNERDRGGADFTRPRPQPEAEAILSAGVGWWRDRHAPDFAVTVDAKPDARGVAWGLAMAVCTLLGALVAARQRWIELRPSEGRLVSLVRGPWRLYRLREVASVALPDLEDVVVARSGRWIFSEYAVVAKSRDGAVRRLTGFGGRALAESAAVAIRTAVAPYRQP